MWALRRLGHLSHVFFADASKFSLEHVWEMAATSENATRRLPRVNVSPTKVPYHEEEVEPFNQCALRFCASWRAMLTQSPTFSLHCHVVESPACSGWQAYATYLLAN